MSSHDILVIAGGALAIAAVNWWFFIAGRRPERGGAGNDATPR
jgi:hypothetical protein